MRTTKIKMHSRLEEEKNDLIFGLAYIDKKTDETELLWFKTNESRNNLFYTLQEHGSARLITPKGDVIERVIDPSWFSRIDLDTVGYVFKRGGI